jgi:anaphase-promoting complex subunit 10
MSGKDTHVRGLRILAPIERVISLSVTLPLGLMFYRDQAQDDDPFVFESAAYKWYETIR